MFERRVSMETLVRTPSRRVLRFLVDHRDEPRHSISKTGRRCGESRRAVCVRPVRFPLSPLLVEVLFTDASTPFARLDVECGADFKRAVPCGVVRCVTDSEEDVPVRGMPNLRTEHPAPVRQSCWSRHHLPPRGAPAASTVAARNPTAAAKQAAGSAAGASQW